MAGSNGALSLKRGRRRASLGEMARNSFRALAKAGADAYHRERYLPRLVPIEASRLADPSIELQRCIVATLARALRAERNRGRAGHWTYDLNRHIGLRQAYLAERRLLDERGGGASGGGAAIVRQRRKPPSERRPAE
jgi:hypothetical protein